MHHANRDKSKGHGQDSPITELGRREAEAIGDILGFGKVPVTCIYSGEYLRYQQTAEQLNKHLQVPVIVDSRLNELKTGRGLTGENTGKRIHEFLRDTIAKHGNDDIIICMTSGTVLHWFTTFFFKGAPIKGFQYMQAPTVSPVIFHYEKQG